MRLGICVGYVMYISMCICDVIVGGFTGHMGTNGTELGCVESRIPETWVETQHA